MPSVQDQPTATISVVTTAVALAAAWNALRSHAALSTTATTADSAASMPELVQGFRPYLDTHMWQLPQLLRLRRMLLTAAIAIPVGSPVPIGLASRDCLPAAVTSCIAIAGCIAAVAQRRIAVAICISVAVGFASRGCFPTAVASCVAIAGCIAAVAPSRLTVTLCITLCISITVSLASRGRLATAVASFVAAVAQCRVAITHSISSCHIPRPVTCCVAVLGRATLRFANPCLPTSIASCSRLNLDDSGGHRRGVQRSS